MKRMIKPEKRVIEKKSDQEAENGDGNRQAAGRVGNRNVKTYQHVESKWMQFDSTGHVGTNVQQCLHLLTSSKRSILRCFKEAYGINARAHYDRVRYLNN